MSDLNELFAELDRLMMSLRVQGVSSWPVRAYALEKIINGPQDDSDKLSAILKWANAAKDRQAQKSSSKFVNKLDTLFNQIETLFNVASDDKIKFDKAILKLQKLIRDWNPITRFVTSIKNTKKDELKKTIQTSIDFLFDAVSVNLQKQALDLMRLSCNVVTLDDVAVIEALCQSDVLNELPQSQQFQLIELNAALSYCQNHRLVA